MAAAGALRMGLFRFPRRRTASLERFRDHAERRVLLRTLEARYQSAFERCAPRATPAMQRQLQLACDLLGLSDRFGHLFRRFSQGKGAAKA